MRGESPVITLVGWVLRRREQAWIASSPEPKVVADERLPPHVRHCEQAEEAGGAASVCKRMSLMPGLSSSVNIQTFAAVAAVPLRWREEFPLSRENSPICPLQTKIMTK